MTEEGSHVTLTIAQVVLATRKSDRTVRRWIAQGKLPTTMTEGQHRIDLNDLTAVARGGVDMTRLRVTPDKVHADFSGETTQRHDTFEVSPVVMSSVGQHDMTGMRADHDILSTVLTRVEVMGQQIETLTRQVGTLTANLRRQRIPESKEQAIAIIERDQGSAVARKHKNTPTFGPTGKYQVVDLHISEIPGGAIPCKKWAEMHHAVDSSVEHWFKTGKIPHAAVDANERGGRKRRYFLREHQSIVIREWDEAGFPYKPCCDGCPVIHGVYPSARADSTRFQGSAFGLATNVAPQRPADAKPACVDSVPSPPREDISAKVAAFRQRMRERRS